MNKWIKIVVFCLFGWGMLAGSAWSEANVAIIVGLPENVVKSTPTFAPLFTELEDALKTSKVSWEYFYVNLDIATDDAAKMALGKETLTKVKAANPKIIISIFDNVIKYIAHQVEDVPVVAGYFFSSPEALGLPTKNITGVARRSFAVDIWSIANQITGAKTVSMIGKKNFSMAQVRAGMVAKTDELEKQSGVRLTDMYLCDTFDEWKKFIENSSDDLIYAVGTTMIMDGDKELTSAELVRWTVDHAKGVVVGATEDIVRDGALFAVVTSEGIWGKQIADMVLKAVSGTPVSQIPMESIQKGKLVINAKSAMQKKIEIPFEILSSAEQVYE